MKKKKPIKRTAKTIKCLGDNHYFKRLTKTEDGIRNGQVCLCGKKKAIRKFGGAIILIDKEGA